MNKTINEVYVEYLDFLKLNRKQTTIYKIQLQFKNYILPELGEIKINELNKEVYIKFLVQIQNLGYKSSFYNQIQRIMAGLYDYLMLDCDLANVKRIRIHDFRHSHATILHKNNVKVKQIQERLGHSDINTTLNTYIHIQKSEEKRLIRKINLLRYF